MYESSHIHTVQSTVSVVRSNKINFKHGLRFTTRRCGSKKHCTSPHSKQGNILHLSETKPTQGIIFAVSIILWACRLNLLIRSIFALSSSKWIKFKVICKILLRCLQEKLLMSVTIQSFMLLSKIVAIIFLKSDLIGSTNQCQWHTIHSKLVNLVD